MLSTTEMLECITPLVLSAEHSDEPPNVLYQRLLKSEPRFVEYLGVVWRRLTGYSGAPGAGRASPSSVVTVVRALPRPAFAAMTTDEITHLQTLPADVTIWRGPTATKLTVHWTLKRDVAQHYLLCRAAARDALVSLGYPLPPFLQGQPDIVIEGRVRRERIAFLRVRPVAADDPRCDWECVVDPAEVAIVAEHGCRIEDVQDSEIRASYKRTVEALRYKFMLAGNFGIT